MTKNTLQERMNQGQKLIGSWISIAHPAIAEIMANAGFDWIAIDLEHSVISLAEAENLIRIIQLKGVSPLVRLTYNDRNQIKRVMDSGAEGIIVPMVNTRNDAENAVKATRYPPSGFRGVGLARAQEYGSGFERYFDWQKTNPVVIAQIEHIDGVKNIDEILEVDGISGIIIGPYDLSASMNIPGKFDDSEFKETLDYLLNKLHDAKIPIGIHLVEPDEDALINNFNLGYQFVAYSVDIRILDATLRSAIVKYKEI